MTEEDIVQDNELLEAEEEDENAQQQLTELHKLRLKIGTLKQVIELLTFNSETQPVSMFAPIAAEEGLEPVALLPVQVKPESFNNIIYKLNDEYYVNFSVKETSLHLKERLIEYEAQEKYLENTLKQLSMKAKNKLTNNEGVRNISEYMSEEEYQAIKSLFPLKRI